MRKMPKIAYEPTIDLFIKGTLIYSTKYMNSLYVYRMPIIKAASFALLTFPIPVEYFADIEKELIIGGFPEIKITFHLADMEVRVPPYSFLELPAGAQFYYTVMHAVSRANFSTTAPVLSVSCYLVQTFIHNLFLGNSFNKIFYDMTAYDALLEYELSISERFAHEIGFKKLIPSSTLNSFEYKNLLIKSANDLTVPHYLMTTYKITNSLNFYFFDDFDTSGGAVVGLFIDFTKALGEPWHIYEDPDKFDISRTLRSKGFIQLGDKIESLRKTLDNASIYIKHSSGSTYHRKIKTDIYTPQLHINNTVGNIYGTRNTVMNNSRMYLEARATNQHVNVYAPDNFENAALRYDILKDFLRTQTESIYKFEVYECHIDAIQFYRKYTLDQTDLRSYYAPVSIVNTFSRINPHETPVNHTSTFQCIKFPAPDPPISI